jgi:hypothetical protein
MPERNRTEREPRGIPTLPAVRPENRLVIVRHLPTRDQRGTRTPTNITPFASTDVPQTGSLGATTPRHNLERRATAGIQSDQTEKTVAAPRSPSSMPPVLNHAHNSATLTIWLP